mmetsp:Transcript_6936/g.12615  ORF Transcript_6936/g.12615 Transcript_6936/m.12615 type:complete len:267 (+) Transcript_6936:1271-2071(+)
MSELTVFANNKVYTLPAPQMLLILVTKVKRAAGINPVFNYKSKSHTMLQVDTQEAYEAFLSNCSEDLELYALDKMDVAVSQSTYIYSRFDQISDLKLKESIAIVDDPDDDIEIMRSQGSNFCQDIAKSVESSGEEDSSDEDAQSILDSHRSDASNTQTMMLFPDQHEEEHKSHIFPLQERNISVFSPNPAVPVKIVEKSHADKIEGYSMKHPSPADTCKECLDIIDTDTYKCTECREPYIVCKECADGTRHPHVFLRFKRALRQII